MDVAEHVQQNAGIEQWIADIDCRSLLYLGSGHRSVT
jgi:hypothetical protein